MVHIIAFENQMEHIIVEVDMQNIIIALFPKKCDIGYRAFS